MPVQVFVVHSAVSLSLRPGAPVSEWNDTERMRDIQKWEKEPKEKMPEKATESKQETKISCEQEVEAVHSLALHDNSK